MWHQRGLQSFGGYTGLAYQRRHTLLPGALVRMAGRWGRGSGGRAPMSCWNGRAPFSKQFQSLSFSHGLSESFLPVISPARLLPRQFRALFKSTVAKPAKNSLPLNNTRVGVLSPRTVKNLYITFDSPKFNYNILNVYIYNLFSVIFTVFYWLKWKNKTKSRKLFKHTKNAWTFKYPSSSFKFLYDILNLI